VLPDELRRSHVICKPPSPSGRAPSTLLTF
jgi:hypothetical protein